MDFAIVSIVGTRTKSVKSGFPTKQAKVSKTEYTVSKLAEASKGLSVPRLEVQNSINCLTTTGIWCPSVHF